MVSSDGSYWMFGVFCWIFGGFWSVAHLEDLVLMDVDLSSQRRAKFRQVSQRRRAAQRSDKSHSLLAEGVPMVFECIFILWRDHDERSVVMEI